MPTVSVIIPTHNRAELLPRAVQSVLNQSYQDFELIIVDDASNDDTPAVMASFNDPRIKTIRHSTNRRGSAARNTGINAATGEWVAFLDDDDKWLPDKLTRQLAAVQAGGSDQVVVYTGLHHINPNGEVSRTFTPSKTEITQVELLYGNYVGSTSTVMAPREALLTVGGFDATLRSCQDWDLWIRLADQCRFVAVPEPLVNHHLSSIRVDTNLEAQLQGRFKLLDKIKPQLQALPWWARQRILANHYLMIAGHYAGHRQIRAALTFATKACVANVLNLRAWVLLARTTAYRQ
ncbi:MAG: hypothetical protein FOGNACKC_03203 [Anaerolineae bacterium]|nr:hypothetical protein [Anaerolineae bacterium]